jgi:ankyrin repeat protein
MHGGRPLHTAADTNQPKVVEALLECGADRNALLMDDTLPLYLAAQNGFTEVVRVLVEHRCQSDFCKAQSAATLDFEMPSGPSSSQVHYRINNMRPVCVKHEGTAVPFPKGGPMPYALCPSGFARPNGSPKGPPRSVV